MAIQIVPYESHHTAQVKEFNRRLQEAGASPFPLSERAPGETPPLARACGIDFHHFLAVDEAGAVRGGYFMRTQPFWIRGQIHTAGHYTAPLSEGVADRRYAGVGAMLLSHALKVNPLLFAMGMGGLNNPLPRMLKAMGWAIFPVPFFFHVLNGSAFFRGLGPLHTSFSRSIFANVLAATGVGHAGIRLVHRARSRAGLDRRLEIAPASSFEAWADEPWNQTRDRYSFSAVRDSRYLQYLYPPSKEFYPLLASAGGIPRGWVQLMRCQPRNASFFGNMRVMAVVDGVATAPAIPSLVLAAVEQAKREKADLVFSNQMHSDWTAALRSCGFLEGPSNYLLALSKGLTRLLEPLPESAPRIHFNRGDGDGRVNLTK